MLEEGTTLEGYAALIAGHGLSVPVPDYLCAIGTKHKKYEGMELAVFKALFMQLEPDAVDGLYFYLGYFLLFQVDYNAFGR